MTASRIGGWLLVVLAIGGLALAVPLVTAHGDGPMAGDDHQQSNATAADHADRMASHAGDHMGDGAHMMDGSHMGDRDHMRDGAHMGDRDHRHATGGQGHC